MTMDTTNSTRGTILLVDADPNSATAISHELGQLGYEVHTVTEASRVNTVLDLKFKEEKPALIIVDVLLPQICGFDVVKRLASKLGDEKPPILMISKFPSPEDEIQVVDVGAQGLLPKPLSGKKLSQFLERLSLMRIPSGDQLIAANESRL